MSTDVLSEVLRAVRLSGAVFFRVDGAAPWVAQAPPARAIAASVMPGAEHVIEFHVVTQGSCWAGLLDGQPVQLHEGDVLMFPQGDAHVVASAPGLRASPELDMYRPPECARLPVALSINHAGQEKAQIVCGFLGCDARPFNPLLSALPRMLHVPRQLAAAQGLVEPLIRVAIHETVAMKAGGETMLARLSELLFVEMVRHYLSSLPAGSAGWLAGLRDEFIGRALGALHDRPAHAWSIEELARQVGMSRSLLAERFHEYVGAPPMQYLARWRMQLAAGLLAGTNLTIGQVAERVGYGSEAALSRAFKRLVGVAPSAWREGARPEDAYVAPDADQSGDDILGY